MTDLRYELRHPKESFHNTSITMDCDQCTIVTLHGKPMFTKVITRKPNTFVEPATMSNRRSTPRVG